MDERAQSPAASGFRPNGALVMALIVLGGLGAGAGFYRWKQPAAKAEVERKAAAAPKTPEGRVATWLSYGGEAIRRRLRNAAFAPDLPWLVTHAVEAADGGAPAVYGLDLEALDEGLVRAEGLRVVVALPAPRLLGHRRLEGRNALGVPTHASPEDAPDAAGTLARKVEWLLHELAGGLERDIEGARLVVTVGAAAAAEG